MPLEPITPSLNASASAPNASCASLPDQLAALAEAENAALQARRASFGEGSPQTAAQMQALPRVGLALSGGGVRSATFALGLMRGLAQSGRLAAASSAAAGSIAAGAAESGPHEDPAAPSPATPGPLARLDYLSTVSGGGYIGAMFGRLVQRVGMARAQELMASSGSVVLEWLRRNGRYLTPAGSRDTGIAVVTYLRAWLAIHTEFMFACMLLGLLVTAPHLWQHSYQLLDPLGWSKWFSPWWALATWVWVVLAPGLIVGYWSARDAPERSTEVLRVMRHWKSTLMLLVFAGATLLLWNTLGNDGSLNPLRHGMNWSLVASWGLTSVVIGQCGVMLWLAGTKESHALSVARVRNWLTRALRWVMLAALTLVGLGCLDLLSWWILEEILTGNRWLWRGVGAGSIALVVLRALMQPLQQIAADTSRKAVDWLPRILNIGSMIGLLALVTAWTVALQWFVFAPDPLTGLRDVPAWMRATMLAVVWAAWVLLTGGNAQMANTSSLHSFYRARLTRAYLAVGNPQRSIDPEHPRKTDVTTVVEGDDTRLASYRPEEVGGPIHLINTCLNQTRDDQSGLYNADRKGTAVTATWRGFEVGPREFMALGEDFDAGTLGRWVAVSGAAASPGAGSYTARGLALLVYFLGVRLGYWMRAPRERVALRWLSHLAWRCWPKPLMLSSEASATFYGVERPWWYLSDGGHFENTGVYPLLKRELDFIILSDASCDAKYEFGDLENLVRKARIDFGAEIDFYTHNEAARLFAGESQDITVLSPEDMADNHSCRGVMLARIRYRERPGPVGPDGRPGALYRPEGTLLVVKPNLHDALDVDLLAYAQKHQSFPHESTGDQSFDEAQWESYHRLGEDFGRVLQDSWLGQLPGWRAPAQHNMRIAARLSGLKTMEAPRAEPLWRRGARATAIGTTLGLGASGTLLLSLWQVQEQVQRNQTDEQNEARKLFTEFSLRLQDLDGTCPKIPEHVVTTAASLFELRGGRSLQPLEEAGLERMADRVAEECKKPVRDDASCLAGHQRMQRDVCTLVGKSAIEDTALNYWHPSASRGDQARASAKVWQSVAAYVPIPQSWTVAPATQVASVTLPPDGGQIGSAAGAVATTPNVAPTPSKSGIVRGDQGTTGQGASGVVTAPPSSGATTPTIPATSTTSATPSIADLCGRTNGGYTTVYLQIYDEASRPAATALREAYLKQAGSALQVAPIENVVRSAELRQQRRAVPWPKATFVVHDPNSTGCAAALAKLVGPPWAKQAGDTDPPWIRGLPSRLQANLGVIELWLPPVATYAQAGAYAGPFPNQDR